MLTTGGHRADQLDQWTRLTDQDLGVPCEHLGSHLPPVVETHTGGCVCDGLQGGLVPLRVTDISQDLPV